MIFQKRIEMFFPLLIFSRQPRLQKNIISLAKAAAPAGALRRQCLYRHVWLGNPAVHLQPC